MSQIKKLLGDLKATMLSSAVVSEGKAAGVPEELARDIEDRLDTAIANVVMPPEEWIRRISGELEAVMPSPRGIDDDTFNKLSDRVTAEIKRRLPQALKDLTHNMKVELEGFLK